MDITQLILDDHHEQRRLFAQLEEIPREDTETLAAVWKRLAAFLELHAAAEEKLFYPQLLKLGKGVEDNDPVDETDDAIHDHNDIRGAVSAVSDHPVASDEWYAAIDAVNVANGDHMAEEEREALTDFRRHTSLQTRHDMAVAFLGFEAEHVTGVEARDKDPDEYIEANTPGG